MTVRVITAYKIFICPNYISIMLCLKQLEFKENSYSHFHSGDFQVIVETYSLRDTPAT